MRKPLGFTLIELVIFIAITSIMASAILLSLNTSLLRTPGINYTVIANQLANRCMEAFLGQRRLNGYVAPFNSCPNSNVTLPTMCTTPALPSGFSIKATITCGPTLASDSTASSTLNVIVSGSGDATLTMLIANY